MLETAKLHNAVFGSLPKSFIYYLIINFNNHTDSHICHVVLFAMSRYLPCRAIWHVILSHMSRYLTCFVWYPKSDILCHCKLHFINMPTISNDRGHTSLVSNSDLCEGIRRSYYWTKRSYGATPDTIPGYAYGSIALVSHRIWFVFNKIYWFGQRLLSSSIGNSSIYHEILKSKLIIIVTEFNSGF